MFMFDPFLCPCHLKPRPTARALEHIGDTQIRQKLEGLEPAPQQAGANHSISVYDMLRPDWQILWHNMLQYFAASRTPYDIAGNE